DRGLPAALVAAAAERRAGTALAAGDRPQGGLVARGGRVRGPAGQRRATPVRRLALDRAADRRHDAGRLVGRAADAQQPRLRLPGPGGGRGPAGGAAPATPPRPRPPTCPAAGWWGTSRCCRSWPTPSSTR